MSRELFLARRLLEAAADPYAPPSESEVAASELAMFTRRFDEAEKSGYPVRVEHFDQMRVDDFSPGAWLLLIENAEQNDATVPDRIIEPLYQNVGDEIIRLRLVSGVLGHPRVRQSFEDWRKQGAPPTRLEDLPDCWPKLHLIGLDELRRAEKTAEANPSESLLEFVLYLLQDGSFAAQALAAAAVTPEESWREAAHQLVQNVVRSVDPELTGYGEPFRRARI